MNKQDLVIQNGRVFDGFRFAQCDVRVEDGVIVEISPHIEANDAEVVRADGKLVIPGMVDAHVHLRGISSDAFGVPGEVCAPMGVTAVADAGGEQGSAGKLAAMQLKTAVYAVAPIVDNRPDLKQCAARVAQFGSHAVGVKVYFDTTISPVCSIRPLAEICAFAHERGLHVMVHCAHSPVSMSEIVRTLSAGDVLTHCYHGGAHTAADDGFDCLHLAQARGIWRDAGFAGHVHTDFSILRNAIQNGAAPDIISSDMTRLSVFRRGGRYGLPLCMSIARTCGMGEPEILRAVTSNPACALGRADQWGTLKVGRCADLAILEYADEPFSLIDGTGTRCADSIGYRCAWTISDGLVTWRA